MLERAAGPLASWVVCPLRSAKAPAPLRSLLLGARVHRAVAAMTTPWPSARPSHNLAESHGRHDRCIGCCFRRGFAQGPRQPAPAALGGGRRSGVPESHRSTYGLIGLSYRSSRMGITPQAELLIPPIEAMATALENDPHPWPAAQQPPQPAPSLLNLLLRNPAHLFC